MPIAQDYPLPHGQNSAKSEARRESAAPPVLGGPFSSQDSSNLPLAENPTKSEHLSAKKPFTLIAAYSLFIIFTSIFIKRGNDLLSAGGSDLEAFAGIVEKLGALGILAYIVWWWTRDQARRVKELVDTVQKIEVNLRLLAEHLQLDLKKEKEK